MSNTVQYLDYVGLKYYDRKLKEKLSSLMPENGKDGQDGQDGEDGLTPEFRIKDDKLQYRYTIEGDEAWRDLGNVKGADGSIGADGTSVTIESTEDVKDDSDNVIGIKINFSDGKEITINHGKDGADGEDGDVLNMQLGEEIKTNVACGALDIGQTLTKEMTLAQIVKKLTTKVYEPSKKNNPKATLTMTNQSVKVEVGTTLAPILTPGFNDGKFNSYGLGATIPSDMNAGCVATDYSIYRNSKVGTKTTSTLIFDYSDPEGKKPGFTAYDKENYKIGEEIISYTIKIDYDESKNYPTNSNGEQDTSLKYDGGNADNNTAATSTTSTISSALYNFHKKGNLTVNDDYIINANGGIEVARTKTITENNTPTTIQNLTNGNLVFVDSNNKANIDYGKYTSAGPNGIPGLLGDKSYFFVPAELNTSCPSGYKYKLLADDTIYYPQNNSKNAIAGWYKLGQQDSNEKWSDLVVKIPDAAGKLRDYHVYKFKAAIAYTGAAFLRFSCVSNTTSEASGVKYQNDSEFFAK